jgi:hypothetical protein
MSNARRRRPQQQQHRPPERTHEARPVDIWRPVPPLADPEPILVAGDPTAMLRSLGDPPLPGVGVVAGHYIAAVTTRAAGLAASAAASADLLGRPDD